MTGALIILAAMVVVGAVLYIHHRMTGASAEPVVEPAAEVCCGQHAVCEKTSLLITDDRIEYFDDEELDRFSGRSPESYTPAEEEELRDVLLTLSPDDVAPWARSLALRKIELPASLRDELLLLVAENRQNAVS